MPISHSTGSVVGMGINQYNRQSGSLDWANPQLGVQVPHSSHTRGHGVAVAEAGRESQVVSRLGSGRSAGSVVSARKQADLNNNKLGAVNGLLNPSTSHEVLKSWWAQLFECIEEEQVLEHCRQL